MQPLSPRTDLGYLDPAPEGDSLGYVRPEDELVPEGDWRALYLG